MTASAITSDAELEGIIGKTPPAVNQKVIDHLDAGALGWIARSPLMFAAITSADGRLHVAPAGGDPGFVMGDDRTLQIPRGAIGGAFPAQPGLAFASLFFLPGIGETLRVNGRVAAHDDDWLRVSVDECYGHCAKALIRSGFWDATPLGTPTPHVADFVAASRFMVLATGNGAGEADLSPKGDPAGGLALLDGDSLWFADRPGNRRIDSFRNIVRAPEVAIALLVPGAEQLLIGHGRATITTDAAIRDRLAVRGRVPALAIRVDLERLAFGDGGALARARLWPVRERPPVDPARLFVDHVKLNRNSGVAARLTRAGMAVPGATEMVRAGLDKDYRDNLY